jgi:hypothetical protein
MKSTILAFTICILCCATHISEAQTKWENNAYTYGEFKVGYGLTQFSTGLSEQFESGNFSPSGGILASIAAYRKFEKINHLHFGLKFKGLGAAPSSGDNGQEMFFNFWGTAISVKYFPTDKTAVKGAYLQGGFNFLSQFTQKYRNTEALQFDHQFAIGYSVAIGLGYQYPLKKGFGLVASVEYDWANRNGEVNDIGDMQFQNSNIAIQLGLIF